MTSRSVSATASRSIAPRSVAAAALALPALALVGVAFVLGLRGGGVTPEEWLPVALAAGVAVATLVAVGALPAAPRRAWPALAAVGALLGWSALSLLWSQAPDATLETVARTVLLALAFGVGATCAARPRAALALAVAIGAGGAATALVVLAHLLDGDLESFLAGRLSYPVNYANGAAALLFLAVPPLVALAAAEPLRPIVRAPLGALAALVLAVGATAESRGGTIAIVGALVAVPVLARDRGRAGLTVLAVALPVLVAMPVLAAGSATATRGDLQASGVAALLAAIAAGLATGGLALLDRRRRWPLDGREGRVALMAVAALVALACVALVVRVGNPVTWLDERWDEFSHPAAAAAAAPSDASRFGTGVSNRYDYWRVAAIAARDHPLGGVGAGAFAVPWFRERTLDENVTDAHSWVTGTLAETGLVGLALLTAVFGLSLAGAWRARHGPGAWPIAAAALGGTAVYYVLHAGLDWLGRIPAVSLPAFVALGALATGGEAGRLALAGVRTRAVGAAVAVAGALLVLPLYVANRAVVRGQEQAARSTTSAIDDLDRAADVDPFAIEPLIVKSTLLAGDGDAAGAQGAAAEAVDRGPNDWTAWTVLAEARLLAGDLPGARAAVERVAELNPRARQLQALRETLAEPTPQP